MSNFRDDNSKYHNQADDTIDYGDDTTEFPHDMTKYMNMVESTSVDYDTQLKFTQIRLIFFVWLLISNNELMELTWFGWDDTTEFDGEAGWLLVRYIRLLIYSMSEYRHGSMDTIEQWDDTNKFYGYTTITFTKIRPTLEMIRLN